jgi:hypothetical protein
MPSPFPLYSCLLSPLTLAIFMFLPKCLPWTYPLKASPLFWESLRVASYLSLPWFLFTSCRLTSFALIPSLVVFFIYYHPHLVIHRPCLDTHLYSYSLKIPSLPPQFESDNLPIWPLDVPSPFPLAGPILTPYLVVLIFLVLMPIYFLSYALVRYHL